MLKMDWKNALFSFLTMAGVLNIATWNVRGMRAPEKQCEIMEMAQKEKD